MRYPVCSRGRGLFSSNEKLIASKDYIFFHKKIIFGNNKVFLGRENRDYRCVASEYSLTKSLYSEGLSNLRFFCLHLYVFTKSFFLQNKFSPLILWFNSLVGRLLCSALCTYTYTSAFNKICKKGQRMQQLLQFSVVSYQPVVSVRLKSNFQVIRTCVFQTGLKIRSWCV